MEIEYHSDEDDSYAIVSSVTLQTVLEEKNSKGWKDLRGREWSHLIVSLLNSFAHVALVILLMYSYPASSSHYVFSALLLMKLVFASFFLFHGLFREQPFQIMVQVLTILVLWGLDFIYFFTMTKEIYTETSNGLYEKQTILFYTTCGLAVINSLTGATVAWKYWTTEQIIFKTVGTDMTRISFFRNLFFGFSLLVFDLEISFVALVLFLRNGFLSMFPHEIVVISIGVVFLICWMLLGYRAMRMESHVLTYIFLVLSLVQPSYMIYLFIRNIKYTQSSDLMLTVSTHSISLLLLLVHLTLLAAVVSAQHYYGRGYGDVLVNGVQRSVKNSAEYEELRRILFHPINHERSYYTTITTNAEVY